MITDLWIENFKGIGKRQHIPLRPVTLLFGANSAGKSTVLHALLYLREVLQHGNFDSQGPIDGENTVSFGGAESLLHRDNESAGVGTVFRIEARFFASLEQVDKFGARLNRRHIEPTLGTVSQTNAGKLWISDPLLPYREENRTIPISIEFVVGAEDGSERFTNPSVNEWDSSSFLKGLTVTIGETLFFDARRSEENKPLECLINLLHPAWNIASGTCELSPVLEEAIAALTTLIVDDVIESGEPELTFITHILSDPQYWSLDSPTAAKLVEQITEGTSGLKIVPLHELLSMTFFTEIIDESSTLKDLVERLPIAFHQCELVMSTATSTANRPSNSLDAELLRKQLCGVLISNKSILSEMVENEELDGPSYADLIDLLRHISFFAGGPIALDRSMWSTTFHLEWSDLAPSSDPHLENPNRMGHASKHIVDDNSFGFSTDDFISRAIKGSLTWLRDHVQGMLYVGPKRSMVPRALTSDSVRSLQTWGNGLAAWRWMLSGDGQRKIRECSEWLGNRLGTGYEFVIQDYAEISREHDPGTFLVDEMLRKLDGDEVSELDKEQLIERLWDISHEFRKAPSIRKLFLVKSGVAKLCDAQDLGEGITQVVPVIAACVRGSSEKCLVAIEQPELHLHPSVAAKLGDLLVSSMLQEGDWDTESTQSQSLIETHSEHLILRILRRVRQTTHDELPEHIPPVKPDDVCVMWVDNMRGGTTFQRLRIDDQGEFIDRWPQGFFSERAEELF